MERPDGSEFFFDLNTRQSSNHDFKYECLTCTAVANSGDPWKFLVFEFNKPPLKGCGALRFLRLTDIQNALAFCRADAVDGKWIARNWTSWIDSYGKLFGPGPFPGFRSKKSLADLHAKKPEEFPEPTVGQHCMDTWAASPLATLFLLLRLHKTCKGSNPVETATEKARRRGGSCRAAEKKQKVRLRSKCSHAMKV